MFVIVIGGSKGLESVIMGRTQASFIHIGSQNDGTYPTRGSNLRMKATERFIAFLYPKQRPNHRLLIQPSMEDWIDSSAFEQFSLLIQMEKEM